MAGTMMKTRRRVKRTVREMPRRLTIRLSKGSSRNMVGDAGQASALLPVNKAGLRWSSPSAPAWGGPTPFPSSHPSTAGTETGQRMSAEGGPEGLPGDRLQADGAGSVFSPGGAARPVSSLGALWALLCWHCFQKFPCISCPRAFSR